MPARAQIMKITSSTNANTSALAAGFRMARNVWSSDGSFPSHSCRLTEYRAKASKGATITKPDNAVISKTMPPMR